MVTAAINAPKKEGETGAITIGPATKSLHTEPLRTLQRDNTSCQKGTLASQITVLTRNNISWAEREPLRVGGLPSRSSANVAGGARAGERGGDRTHGQKLKRLLLYH